MVTPPEIWVFLGILGIEAMIFLPSAEAIDRLSKVHTLEQPCIVIRTTFKIELPTAEISQ